MKLRTFAIAWFALLVSACATTVSNEKIHQPSNPAPIKDQRPVYGDYRDTISAIVQILDSGYYNWAFLNLKEKDTSAFHEHLEKFQADLFRQGLAWDVVMERYYYALSICGSSITLPEGERDRRFDEIIRRGIPTGDWTIPGEVKKDGRIKGVTFYCLSWYGIEAVILESDYRAGRPVRESVPDQEIPIAEMAIKSVVNYTYSKRGSDSCDVTFSVWAPLNQLNLATFNRGFLDYIITLTDTKGKVITHTRSVPLVLYRMMAEVATNPEDHFVRGYVNFIGLPADSYHVVLEVRGSKKNSDFQTLAMVVPSPKSSANLGEPTILYTNPPRGDLLGKSEEGDLVYSSPFTQFLKSTELQVCQTVDLAPGFYILRVILFPLPVHADKENPRIKVGPQYNEGPADGEVLTGKLLSAMIPDSILTERDKPTPRNDISIAYEGTYQAVGPNSVVVFPISLQKLRIGRYKLIVTIVDKEKGQPSGHAEMREPLEVIASI
ncbi:MAG: hypothetical protein AAB787_01365 [Patescibacteria group bacterium]